MRYTELSPAAQSAYAELHDAATHLEIQRSVAGLSGNFASKTVKGRHYWYFQFRDISGKVRQIYVGPDNEPVRRLIKLKDASDSPPLIPFARSAIALGCAPLTPVHFRIIKRLADYGFFKAGGMLVGTHAYLASGNILGVSWHGATKTQYMDFAHPGNNVSIALPADIDVDVHGAIQSLEMGLLPITSFEGQPGATYLNPRTPDLRLDFLTSMHRGRGKPVIPANLNIALQPLKFMEYSLNSPMQATVLCAEGAVVVNIPDPIRYGLHKLLVYGEREGQYRVKATKDLRQAASMVSYYQAHRADQLDEAREDLESRGPGWRSRFKQGWAAMEKVLAKT
jgi:hypothetical protein